MALAIFCCDDSWFRRWNHSIFCAIYREFLARSGPYYLYGSTYGSIHHIPMYVSERVYLIKNLNSRWQFDDLYFHYTFNCCIKSNRSDVLLPCVMGELKDEAEVSNGWIFGCRTYDGIDWYAIRYKRSKICSLDMARHRPQHLCVCYTISELQLSIYLIFDILLNRWSSLLGAMEFILFPFVFLH